MEAILQATLKVTLAIFMIGSLLKMGLQLELDGALRAVRNVRFVVVSVFWSFVIGPLLAVVIANILPIAGGHRLGLILLGFAPGAPFIPMLAERARADLNFVACYLVIAAIGTILLLPLFAPFVAPGLNPAPLAIARPLVLFVAIPLIAGTAIRALSRPLAERAWPIVGRITSADTALMLAVIVMLYWREVLASLGSFAILTQLLYFGLLSMLAYSVNVGLQSAHQTVIVLGLCTRNVGAALAPLMTIPSADPGATVMCVISLFVTLALGFGAATLLSRRQFATSEVVE